RAGSGRPAITRRRGGFTGRIPAPSTSGKAATFLERAHPHHRRVVGETDYIRLVQMVTVTVPRSVALWPWMTTMLTSKVALTKVAGHCGFGRSGVPTSMGTEIEKL